MASILRQIVAGPRLRHAETDLDLCYVTSQIIATSGPSSHLPQRAYRNPLDQFVKFLDEKHESNWAIWEFRAEGTGYSDEKVHGRIWHYPWPDHHPPPFRLVPDIIAGMKDWLQGNLDGRDERKRIVVVHCKAGKGRSGTMACSYLISECGWKLEEALARFTERRMRPGFGEGVSIPSQLRWVGYVDRWTKCNKIYVDRQIEILELHVWGLRNGVKVQVQGFVDEGSDEDDMKTQNISQSSINTSQHFDYKFGGSAVIFQPSSPIILPSSDINIDFERRRKACVGWKFVTSLAHIWFNCYFEGQGPEQGGKPRDYGVYNTTWKQMDGIKGSIRKGTRALDRLAVVWRAHHSDTESNQKEAEAISGTKSQSAVPQPFAADRQDMQGIEINEQNNPGLKLEFSTETHSDNLISLTHEKESKVTDQNKKSDTNE